MTPDRKGGAMLEPITWFWQSAIRWRDSERTVYIDPRNTPADAPPGDVILITHAHGDHFDPVEIERLSTRSTKLVAPHDIARDLRGDVTPVAPGESHEVGGLRFTTVPAYNIVEQRLDAHPKENRWVGYILELGGGTYYHAGDTDHVPELDSVNADVVFLPVGGDPFTMAADEAADLAKIIDPQIAVPMHFGFRVGSKRDGERFRELASPVPVEILTPVNPFERE
jgi:L-ascorbate metabolism protein UlaG (beta-lactamase superfamily)